MIKAEVYKDFTDLSPGRDEKPPAPPKTKFSLKEVEEIRMESYLSGQQSVEAQAADQAAKAFEQIAQSAQALFGQVKQIAWEQKSHASQIAFLIGKKLASAALDKYPETEITQLVEQNLEHISHEPVIRISIAPPLKDALSHSLHDLKQRSNLEVEFELIADESLTQSDCQLVWSNGGITRDLSEIEHEIEDAINQRLASDAQAETQLELFS